MIYCGLAYWAIGVASAVISNPIAGRTLQASLRLGALLLGMLVFLFHIGHEIVRLGSSPRVTAFSASVALAGGTFLLAVYAVLSAAMDVSRPIESVLLALVLWPFVTGILGFIVAAAISVVACRLRGTPESS
jgi:hypothetical protein